MLEFSRRILVNPSIAAFLLLAAVTTSATAEQTLKDARTRWLRGNYHEARAIYEKLSSNPEHQVAAVLGISRCLQSVGEYEKALDVVATASKQIPGNPQLLARQAEVLHLRGQWEEAESAAAKALAANPDSIPARWVLGQIHRDRGDLKKADAELRWLVRAYSERSGTDKEIRDADELLVIALSGAENARRHKMADQFKVVLNDVLGDALRNEKDFWPAECLAGLLLLEKYNQAQALEAFHKALAINPNAAEALVGKGLTAVQKFEMRDAELFANRALKFNPHLAEARRLLADIHLFAGDLRSASQELEKAREVNPRDESTLGRWAACQYLSKNRKAFDTLVQEVSQCNPRPGVFYYTLAERLDERKRYDEAEAYYKRAMELQPSLPWPQNGLGLLYMRLGREVEAREILAKALRADEFNVRVSNSLRVLRHLEKYETAKSQHFELRFDPQTDALLARYIIPYLEGVYKELTEKFGYQPPRPILVEVFNNHEMFSGRVVALPDLHTIGASTGRIVAMVSPNGKGVRSPFNWARVLRHELVHVFNLEQTGFHAPHWFTEGLAVIQEGYPRPQQWNQLLRDRVPAGNVFDLDSIDLAFIRPRSPLDWHMAYCQSQVYVEYLTKEYGPNAIKELLKAYEEGLDTGAAITKVCGVDKAAFENGYRKHLASLAAAIQGQPSGKSMSYRQLQRAFEAEPENPDLAARMAEQYLIRRDNKEARRLAESALAKNGTQPLASFVKARLLIDAGEEDRARSVLEAALDRQTPDLKVLQALGKLYYEAKDLAKAAELYERACRIEPYENKWWKELARIYTQTGDRSKQIEVLKELVPTDADDLDSRKRLAQMLHEAGNHAESERYAREAMEIDVRDAQAQQLLLDALDWQGKTQEAKRVRELLRK